MRIVVIKTKTPKLHYLSPKNTNTIVPASIITPALLQSIWVDFVSSYNETDEPIDINNSNHRIDDCDYGYTKYESSTDEAEIDDGYHSYETTYDSDYSYDSYENSNTNDSVTYANWINLKFINFYQLLLPLQYFL